MTAQIPIKEAEIASVNEAEVAKGSQDATIQLYLEFAGRDEEWKGLSHPLRCSQRVFVKAAQLYTPRSWCGRLTFVWSQC